MNEESLTKTIEGFMNMLRIKGLEDKRKAQIGLLVCKLLDARDIEELSSKFHDVYIAEAKRQGDCRHPERYKDLAENIREYDRVLARYVLKNFTPK